MYEISRRWCNFWYRFYDTATVLNVNTPDTKHKWKFIYVVSLLLSCMLN